MTHLLAAVDLGSNSFRLVVGRINDNSDTSQIYLVDRLKETVRLAAGLDDDHYLDEAAIGRAIAVLQRFGERLHSFDPARVRAVATQTFRMATNIAEFLPRAEAALGFPIEIIAGREEARLIYQGVAHSLPESQEKRLVVDIGGASTEFVIGASYAPELLESLQMGCVTFSQQFFPGGAITADAMKRAEIAARQQVEVLSQRYRRAGWKFAYGSSGTAKALAAILPATGLSAGGITLRGLQQLRQRLIRAGSVEAAALQDIKSDRAAVLPGGLAIMRAVFEELDIELMHAADGALRVGVLHDLAGRDDIHDVRDATVQQFMTRYEIDAGQAQRVLQTALALYQPLEGVAEVAAAPNGSHAGDSSDLEQMLGWVANLHEIGLSIAHANYQRHTAYILGYSDMPGFSKPEQQLLAQLALGHHGRLSREGLDLPSQAHWTVLLCLRLACLLARRREDIPELPCRLLGAPGHHVLEVQGEWLARHPLTDLSLRAEAAEWARLGRPFELKIKRPERSRKPHAA
ncbi:MAG: exopolyphosphatase [Pigmentiphaga sp.]